MFQPRLLALSLLAASASAAALSADDAYLAAKSSCRALKSDPAKRKFRHQWIKVARRFEQVAGKYPQSSRAPEALLSAAKLLGELSQISQVEEDLDAAIADYEKLLDAYPRYSSSDASALALGRIYFQQRGQPEQARRVAAKALALHPRGARAAALKALLAALPEEPKAARAKVQVRAQKLDRPSEKGRRPSQESRTRALLEAIARASANNRRSDPLDVGRQNAPNAIDGTRGKPGDEGARESEDVGRNGVREGAEDEPLAPAKSAPKAWVASPARQNEPAAPADRANPSVQDEPEGEAGAGQTPAALERAARARAIDARGRSADATLAELLGLKIRRVVIDPGHGGHDAGAIGARGTKEKDVALAISLRLRALLADAGLQVVLTRSDDSFVSLEDRAKLANQVHGDLFISIHCNSAPKKKLRGIETYTLNTSSDRYSIRLAARENASSQRGISDLQYILADLATKANTEESSRLASRVQQSLVAHLRAKHRAVQDLGSKEALFYVLLGVRMPAILVETSFLSNPDEERRLSSKAYQGDLAAAIAAGIQEFLGSRQKVAKVAKVD